MRLLPCLLLPAFLAFASTTLAAPPTALETALADVLAGKAPPASVTISVVAPNRGQATIFGNDIGIHDGKSQVTLKPNQALALLKQFSDARFTAMPDHLGGADARPNGVVRPMLLSHEVTLNIAGARKTALQFAGGEQSKPLAALADAILAAAADAAPTGVSATSIKDGLEKLAAGRLDPVTLSILLHNNSWLIHLTGPTIEIRQRSPKGYSDPIRTTLTPEQFAALTKLLASSDLDSFPTNLYAASLTDLYVGILDQKKDMQARDNFANVKPTTHGQKQKDFDTLLRHITTLAETTVARTKK